MSWTIAQVQMTEEPAWGFKETAAGIHAIGRGDGGVIRMALADPELEFGKPTLRDLSDALTAIYGSDFGVHSPDWLSRFNNAALQAVAYRDRRVLLAGDAAHIHAPLGGQGLNIGVQDAVNLGWKLAQVVKGTSPDSLLDTYHAERHPVGARVLKNTLAHVAVRRLDDRSKALADYVAEFLSAREARDRLAADMSQLGLRYPLGDGIHCSDVACRTSISKPLMARGASTVSCTRRSHYCSTSASAVASTRGDGRTGFHRSTPPTRASGSFPRLAASLRRARCWSDLTVTSPGSVRERCQDSRKR